MQLSEILGLPVRDAGSEPVGTVVDVRLTTSMRDEEPTTPTVLGLVISPRTQSSYLGYERSDVNRPRLLAAMLRWRHRGAFVASWADVARVDPQLVTLRAGYTRYSPVLRDPD
jgi:hypothetical protein